MVQDVFSSGISELSRCEWNDETNFACDVEYLFVYKAIDVVY